MNIILGLLIACLAAMLLGPHDDLFKIFYST